MQDVGSPDDVYLNDGKSITFALTPTGGSLTKVVFTVNAANGDSANVTLTSADGTSVSFDDVADGTIFRIEGNTISLGQDANGNGELDAREVQQIRSLTQMTRASRLARRRLMAKALPSKI